jgi:hypothetical protein
VPALLLSVTSVLIATSKYYDVLHVLHFMIPLLAIHTALVILGLIRSVARSSECENMKS